MEQFKCKMGKKGLNYIDIHIVRKGKEHVFNALVKTGSDLSIFSAKALGVKTSKLKKVTAEVGFEGIDVYEVDVDSISIGDGFNRFYGVDFVYVSDNESFNTTPILGMDLLCASKITSDPDEGMTIELDTFETGSRLCHERREKYLENFDGKQININLTDFFFIKDGMYPAEFEVVLAVMKDGSLTAGCATKGSDYDKEYPKGILRQGRGGVIDFKDILAWKPLEEGKVL